MGLASLLHDALCASGAATFVECDFQGSAIELNIDVRWFSVSASTEVFTALVGHELLHSVFITPPAEVQPASQ